MGALGCLINGAPSGRVAVSDRGLQYGDGLFETIAVRNGSPCLWYRHMERLRRGCGVLGLPMPPLDVLLDECLSLIGYQGDGVLKIILTRGSGGRGYLPPVDPTPVRILCLYPFPDYPPTWQDAGVAVTLCRMPMSENRRLAGLKHLNRLDQVLARNEVSGDGTVEGLMCDSRGCVIGGTMTNLFLWTDGLLTTPKLDTCGIAGTVRGLVLEEAQRSGIPVRIKDIRLPETGQAQGMFLTNAVAGVWPVRRFLDNNFDVNLLPAALLDIVRRQTHQPEQ